MGSCARACVRADGTGRLPSRGSGTGSCWHSSPTSANRATHRRPRRATTVRSPAGEFSLPRLLDVGEVEDAGPAGRRDSPAPDGHREVQPTWSPPPPARSSPTSSSCTCSAWRPSSWPCSGPLLGPEVQSAVPPLTYAFLAVAVVVGELRPIVVPRGDSTDEITVSTTLALVLALLGPLWLAVLAQLVGRGAGGPAGAQGPRQGHLQHRAVHAHAPARPRRVLPGRG